MKRRPSDDYARLDQSTCLSASAIVDPSSISRAPSTAATTPLFRARFLVKTKPLRHVHAELFERPAHLWWY